MPPARVQGALNPNFKRGKCCKKTKVAIAPAALRERTLFYKTFVVLTAQASGAASMRFTDRHPYAAHQSGFWMFVGFPSGPIRGVFGGVCSNCNGGTTDECIVYGAW